VRLKNGVGHLLEICGWIFYDLKKLTCRYPTGGFWLLSPRSAASSPQSQLHPGLPGHLVATGCHGDLGTLLGRATLHLQALFILVGQALVVIMLPGLGIAGPALCQLSTRHTATVVSDQAFFIVHLPLLRLGPAVALTHYQSAAARIQAEIVSGFISAASLGFLDNPVTFLLHGFHGVLVEFDSLCALCKRHRQRRKQKYLFHHVPPLHSIEYDRGKMPVLLYLTTISSIDSTLQESPAPCPDYFA
jgi:hypothetical protein